MDEQDKPRVTLSVHIEGAPDLPPEGEETIKRMLGIFEDCLEIFCQRNVRYEDLWKQYGWNDTLVHMRSKVGRTDKQWWLKGAEDATDLTELDDAYDLINYTMFFIMNVMDVNPGG